MKTLLITLLSIVWINTFVLGQSNKNISSEFSNLNTLSEITNFASLGEYDKKVDDLLQTQIINTDLLDIWHLDSLVIYNLTGVDSFAIMKSVNSYNAETREIETVGYERNTPAQDWKFLTRNISTYNANNHQIQSVHYVLENEKWIKNSKYVTEYNENEEDISETNFHWDTLSDTWIKDFMVEFEYNAQGLQSQIVLSHTDIENQEWMSFYKVERNYNEENLLVQQIDYNWDKQNLVWGNSEKLNSSYNDGLRSNDHYFWDINHWKFYKKNREYHVDIDTIGYNSYYFKYDSVWINDSRGQYTLNENGIPTSQESYRLSYETNSWFGELKYESFTSPDEQSSTYIKYRWDVVKNDWCLDEKTERRKNENLFTYYSLTSRYNENLNEWYRYRSSLNYFSQISSIYETSANSELKLFPNPVITTLTVDCGIKDLSETEYAIYSLRGKLIELNKVVYSTIDVSRLNPGLYILKVSSETKVLTAKFTKL